MKIKLLALEILSHIYSFDDSWKVVFSEQVLPLLLYQELELYMRWTGWIPEVQKIYKHKNTMLLHLHNNHR